MQISCSYQRCKLSLNCISSQFNRKIRSGNSLSFFYITEDYKIMNIEQLVSVPSWIIEPVNSKNGLCLGSIHVPRDIEKVKSMQIGAILSIASEQKIKDVPPQIRRLCIELDDRHTERIYNFFNTTYHFIDDNLRHTNVLVHCMAGVSRSATIVIAYLMKKHRMTLKEARALVQSKRPFINPNPGFVKQLQLYDKQLEGDRTCSLI